MLRILLADDHAVVRRGVKQIIAEAFAQATFGEAQNVQELLKLIGSERWDIVVLDLNMPDGSGLEALKQIKTGPSAAAGVDSHHVSRRSVCDANHPGWGSGLFE